MEKLRKFMPIMLALLVSVMTLMFTSCDESDEPSDQVYTFGFSEMSASSPEFLNDMTKIENAYKTALGVKESPFTKHGTAAACDQEVKKACEKAYTTLANEKWHGTYTFTVYSAATGKPVYEVTFKANDDNALL